MFEAGTVKGLCGCVVALMMSEVGWTWRENGWVRDIFTCKMRWSFSQYAAGGDLVANCVVTSHVEIGGGSGWRGDHQKHDVVKIKHLVRRQLSSSVNLESSYASRSRCGWS